MSEARRDVAGCVVEEGRSVRHYSHADKVAVLVDAADYFAALRSAMAAATRSIVVLGWDIDSRTPLVGRSGLAEDGLPDAFLPFVEALVERRPELGVRLLLWDYTLLYALEREPLPTLNLKWRTPPQIKVSLDSNLPLGACHHQKLVVVDGRLAFCGGLDLTIRRWDTPEHRPRHATRVDPGGEPYPPFHDVQMLVDGAAAKRIAEICEERWQTATGEQISLPEGDAPWPEHVPPDCMDVGIGIARTLPETEGSVAVGEVRELYLASIGAARRYIYIENQYLTSDEIADALVSRLHEVPELELLVVMPRAPGGWLEKRTMGAGLQRVMRKLSHERFGGRVRFVYPWVGKGKVIPVMVHAKVMIVDDLFLRVGSSNLNNRSMGVDTECDLAVVATTGAQQNGIRAVLHRLLGEHLGLEPAETAEQLRKAGSLTAVANTGWNDDRGLAPLRRHAEYASLPETLNLVADPETPLHPAEFLGDMFGARSDNRFATARVLKFAGGATVLLSLLLAWSYSPLAEFANPETIVDAVYGARGEWWIYPAILAAFVVGGILLFPLTVLVAVTGVLLGPWTGWLCAMAGSMVSGWTGHAAGRWFGGGPAHRVSGGAFRAVSRALTNHGVVAVVVLRMVPVAPYTVVNLALGAAGVTQRTFMAGTFLGLLPATFVLTMLGDRLREVWRDPHPANVALVALVIVLWVGLAFALQRLVARLRKRGR